MTKYIISRNLIDWKGETGVEEADDEIIRICGKLADALIPVLEKELSSFLTSCEPRVKKRMYEALYDLPRACPLSSFLERSGMHVRLRCAEERTLWSCPGKTAGKGAGHGR
ncbi:MAG: hypothetical protein V8T10_06945 [Merdibacter sp.]